MIDQIINFKSVEEVQKFVNMAVSCPFDIDIGTDRNMIDAKSIMGVMSLGLNRPLRVSYEQDDQAFDQMLDSLKIA